jgi:hypothetical protein
MRRLSAKLAVFGTFTGFGISNAAKDDFPAFEMFPNFRGSGHDTEGLIRTFDKKFQRFAYANFFLTDGLILELLNQISISLILVEVALGKLTYYPAPVKIFLYSFTVF